MPRIPAGDGEQSGLWRGALIDQFQTIHQRSRIGIARYLQAGGLFFQFIDTGVYYQLALTHQP